MLQTGPCLHGVRMSSGDARGIFGVEMFLLEDGSVLLNELLGCLGVQMQALSV